MDSGAERLDLGDLDLLGGDGGYDGYEFNALGEDVDFGEPQPVDVTLASLMADGAPTETIRYENREVSFRVQIVSPDGQGLADGETALLAQVGVRTTLAWTPPDGYGPTTVFRVETSRAKFLFNDFDEMRSLKRRTFLLTLTCLPFARSLEPTVIGAEFVADAVVIADDCEATTGWSIVKTGVTGGSTVVMASPVVDSSVYATGTGSVRFDATGTIVPASDGNALLITRVTKTGLSIDASAGGYFVVRVRSEWTIYTDDTNLDAYLTTSGGGRASVSPLIGEADAAGFLRLSFPVPNASTITGFDFQASLGRYGGSVPAPSLWVDSLGLAANSASSQNLTSFDVTGSMRCEASFLVTSSVGLGDVLLYTVPDLGDGFRPDLARWLVSGTTAADVNAVTGTRISLSSTPTFEAPASMLRAGSYAVLARIRRSAAGSCTVTLDAQTQLDATPIGSEESVTSPTITLTDDDYHVVRIGVIELPPLLTDPASTATVLFTASQTGTGYYLDELLVFPLEDHALTWVACGTGAPSATVASRLWLDEPTPTQPRGARLVGNEVGRLDARYVLPESAGRHVLKPGRNLAYLLSSPAGGADLQITYTAAHHSNASS